MYQKFGIADTFGVPAPAGLVIEGFADANHPHRPAPKEYVFGKNLRDILAFLHEPYGGGLFLTGPTGAGKTSLITQVAARLHWPVQEVTCHGRLELGDLVGHYTMASDGSMQFVYGPLAIAVRDGHLLVLNEIDLADPAEIAGINGILDGMPLVIPEHEGEVIRQHEKFRLVATGNSFGQGDASGLYQGVLRQNVALMDRMRVVKVDYPEPETEMSILAKAAPFIQPAIAEAMIKVANEIRKLFTGEGKEQRLSVTLSTRGLVTWALLASSFKSAPKPLAYSLQQVLLNKMEPAEHEAVLKIAVAVFGDSWQ